MSSVFKGQYECMQIVILTFTIALTFLDYIVSLTATRALRSFNIMLIIEQYGWQAVPHGMCHMADSATCACVTWHMADGRQCHMACVTWHMKHGRQCHMACHMEHGAWQAVSHGTHNSMQHHRLAQNNAFAREQCIAPSTKAQQVGKTATDATNANT